MFSLRNSRNILFLLFTIICFIRWYKLTENELSWDVFGYYLYLPATFIHNDFFLYDISWINDIMSKYPISGTLYQISQTSDNQNIYFFLIGMSILYLPFFFIGHIIALLTGNIPDGFSLPYQYSIALGFLTYTFIGLYFFRKILLNFFDEKITSFVLIIIVLGTNYLHFAGPKNLETANALFSLIALLVWANIKWHDNQKLKHLIIISVAVALCILIKPSEIVCILIPLLWGIYNKESFKKKLELIIFNKNQFYIALTIGLLVLCPQLIYWQIRTGSFLYDSYNNPGIGLDFTSPHILNVLFSFRKGWLLYTPIIIFALVGFRFLYKKNQQIFAATFIYFLITFYIISSWTEWWYGAGYSMRPLVPSYVLLGIPLGYSLERISKVSLAKKNILTGLIVFFIFLNLFQLWQLYNYILHPYRTTRAYYFAIFGKISINEKTKDLLSIERSVTGDPGNFNKFHYKQRNMGMYDFSEKDTNNYDHYIFDSLSNSQVFSLDSTLNFSPEFRSTYEGITSKDHAWMQASVDVFIPEGYNEETPCLVLTFSRKKQKLYAYRAVSIPPEKLLRNQWIKLTANYITPEVRSTRDVFNAYIWHRGKKPIYIDNFRVNIFEPKK